MAEPEIREGFLCPICMKDLGGVADLQEHFEEEHSQEDKAVLQQLKGLFGKAKRKILGKEQEERADGGFGATLPDVPVASGTGVGPSGIDPSLWEPQELGAIRSYTDGFKRVRDARIDRFVVETNKLLIRLDKLINPDAPTDPAKRKAFEKRIVQWAPDSDVNLCTTCGKSFNLTRRRHHCRLCGGIICNKCSQFLPFSYAKKLTNPAFQYEGEGFHRSSSNSSLNSIMSSEGEMHIRTCTECRNLLERRDQQMEQRNAKPMIVHLYDRMKLYKDEAEQVLPTFLMMAESLRNGETTHSLGEANVLRIKIIKLFESIDSLSKRIAILGLDSPDPPPPRVLFLQRSIRIFISQYLQENKMGLQNLPTEEELEALKEQKMLEVQRRVDAERRAATERELRRKEEKEKRVDDTRERVKTVSFDPRVEQVGPPTKPIKVAGWKPVEVVSKVSETEDPMLQQMNIIRGYIKQARGACKMDEVQMLEENLKELQNEYWRQQNMAQDLPPQRPQTITLKKTNSPNWDNKPKVVQPQRNRQANNARGPVQSPLGNQQQESQMQPPNRQTQNARLAQSVTAQTQSSPEYDPTLNPFEDDETPNKMPTTNPFDQGTSPSPIRQGSKKNTASTNPFGESPSDSTNPFES